MDASGDDVFATFSGKKLVKVFSTLEDAFETTFALFIALNFEYPQKASWTWEFIQRYLGGVFNTNGSLRGRKKDPHGLNKCESLYAEVTKVLESIESIRNS